MEHIHIGSEPPMLRMLLVEDDPRETELATHALEWGDGRLNVWHTDSGHEALAFLRQDPPFEDAEPPHVVVTDLKMPQMSGLDLLQAIKAEERITTTPVILLSNSRSPADVEAAYRAGASLYLVKPVELEKFAEAMHIIERLFLDVATVMDGPSAIRTPT